MLEAPLANSIIEFTRHIVDHPKIIFGQHLTADLAKAPSLSTLITEGLVHVTNDLGKFSERFLSSGILLFSLLPQFVIFREVSTLLVAYLLYEVFILRILFDRPFFDEFLKALDPINTEQRVYRVPGLPGDILFAFL